MKFVLIPFLALAMCFGIVATADAARPTTTTYEFTSSSGVTGKVVVMALPNGRTHVRIQAQGLTANTRYALSYSTSTTCGEPADQRTILERVDASTRGSINLNKRLDADASTIGSIAIRSDDGTTLVACASTP